MGKRERGELMEARTETRSVSVPCSGWRVQYGTQLMAHRSVVPQVPVLYLRCMQCSLGGALEVGEPVSAGVRRTRA